MNLYSWIDYLINFQAPVRCATWSPTIPTMIASIGDAQLNLWDISMNIISPVSCKNFQECTKPLSKVIFFPNGRVKNDLLIN